MAFDYKKTTWYNNTAPAITAEQLNRMEQGIEDASNLDVSQSDWNETDTSKHAFIKNKPNVALKSELNSEIERAKSAEQTLTKQYTEVAADVSELQSYIGYTDSDIAGVIVDYANKTYTRIAGAAGKSGGSAFDTFGAFGGRYRCNVSDAGVVNAKYGDDAYSETGSNGQVMVFQPKFYYKVVPMKLEKQSSGMGFHLRKAAYYISSEPREGFKVHPAFINYDGKETNGYYIGAFEASLYDASASSYLAHDEQVMDTSADKLSSVANVKPISGLSQNLTRVNLNKLATNRGTGWYSENVKIACAEQLLMLVEYAGNLQSLIGQGVVSISDNSSYNCSSLTGSTSGNTTQEAASTVNEINGTQTTYSVSGKRSISYRGVENEWGNIWKFIDGINMYGNGSLQGGVPFICDSFTYKEDTQDGYSSAGFTVANAGGYISAFGYSSEEFDWLFMTSETSGDSSLPIGDYFWLTSNLNGYRIAALGSRWADGARAGGFGWNVGYGSGGRYRHIGGRLVYLPKVAA